MRPTRVAAVFVLSLSALSTSACGKLHHDAGGDAGSGSTTVTVASTPAPTSPSDTAAAASAGATASAAATTATTATTAAAHAAPSASAHPAAAAASAASAAKKPLPKCAAGEQLFAEYDEAPPYCGKPCSKDAECKPGKCSLQGFMVDADAKTGAVFTGVGKSVPVCSKK